MAAVIVVLVMVVTAGIGLRKRAPVAARRTSVDLVAAMADRARTTAITRRLPVVMALAAPSDLPAGEDGRCRIGLFQVISEEDATAGKVRTVTALGKWRPLNHGIAWKPGAVDGAVNPWESPRLTLRVGRDTFRPHGIVFGARGGFICPPGSSPAVIRIGEGAGRASETAIPETRLRVGRVTGRIYPSDR